MPVTKDQADMLATLAIACRPHGAPRWDAPGIVAAIGKVKHMALGDVALAVIRAAEDREARTPGVIANTRSTCWQERAADRPRELEVLAPQERCGICSERRDRCERLWATDHAFEPDIKRPTDTDVPATVEALRELVVEAKAEPVVPEPRKPEPNPHVQTLREAMTNPNPRAEVRAESPRRAS